jgi:signal peptidase I
MSEQYSVGDVVRLNNTSQEAEVLELVDDINTRQHGPLLRVNLVGVDPARIVYYPVRSVHLVRRAATVPGEQPGPGDQGTLKT